MKRPIKYHFLFPWIYVLFVLFSLQANAQVISPVMDKPTGPALPSLAERARKWGANDTIIVSTIYHEGEWMPYKELEIVWVSNLSEKKLAKYIEEWHRLRNAVYVTYPYARIAGVTINDINVHLSGINSRKERKTYIKSREKELRAQFGDPLENLSVYQGKVLMKLINRQTGNNCYEIIREYKNGITARLYQTVAFFFGGNLKQEWSLSDKIDRQIEEFVKEIDFLWYNKPQGL